MKDLDEYNKENLPELATDIDILIDTPVDKRKKKDYMQWCVDIQDRMKLFNSFSGDKIYNVKYGK